jgi:hypothetical protein
MLPDLPELKLDLMRMFERYIRVQVQLRMPGLNQSPQHQMHEGRRLRIIRSDGSIEETDLMTASAEARIELSTGAVMSPEERKARLDAIAAELAHQFSEHAFGSISKSLEEAGQSINLGGRPLDGEGLLQIFEKLQIDFDDRGQPKGLSMVTGQGAHAAAVRAFEELESNPKLNVRFSALVQRKQMEYRDREAARKLVG